MSAQIYSSAHLLLSGGQPALSARADEHGNVYVAVEVGGPEHRITISGGVLAIREFCEAVMEAATRADAAKVLADSRAALERSGL